MRKMNKHRLRKKKQAGFTLIEIMVVVVILGVLAALVVPSIMERPEHARQVRAKQDVRTLVNAINLYRLDNFDYPSDLSELASGGYLDKVPKDPWNNDYQYRNPGGQNPGKFDIYSYGKDGREGGNEFDSDIGIWNLDR